MIKKPLFKQTFFLLVIIGASDFFANTLYLYWTVWWYDMLMHFISGVCVGMATVLVIQYFSHEEIGFKELIKIGIISSFVVGILWEFFELYFEATTLADGVIYYRDTSSDLILDVCGGILGVIYGHRFTTK